MERSVDYGKLERIVSLLGGAGLLTYGILRPSIPGVIMAFTGGGLLYHGASGHSVSTSTVTNKPKGLFETGLRVEKTITVDKPLEDVYQFWKELENLPRFMDHLESVHKIDEKHSHWVAKGPAGSHVEWDAEIINQSENEFITWRSLPNSEVESNGSVHFRRLGDDRTEVEVMLRYTPPAGKLGAAFAQLFGEEPSQQIEEDLHKFKRLMESTDTGQNRPFGWR